MCNRGGKFWCATLALVVGLGWLQTAQAAIIAAWDTDGLSGYGPSPWSATFVDPLANVTTGLTRGGGIATGGTPPSDVWGGTGFDSANASEADAIADSEFATLVIQPDSGYKISFATLDANFRRTNTGPDEFIWQYNTGSGFTNIGSFFTYNGTQPNGLAQTQINLSTITALQNVQTAVTFRLVMWSASNANGTWGFGRLSGNDLVFGGTISSIPEPGSLSMLACGMLTLWLFRKRKI